ncbi:HU family DNA-binding protein [Bacteroides sp. 519]|uniref:HU family DNA-binding protein n=1 Tax=Bacteroides sp. 519 TaxID=2302937 RepID=UPI0013D2F609|nr:HU family DNA-binding protein [Bacteroides sp. 519]NDV57584.1 HU family DNA-binding protein [Bacteroides sp. 519]
MNKAELIEAMAQQSGLSKGDAKKALEAFTSIVSDTLKKGDKVGLVGFGTFTVVLRNERAGINPTTQARIQIPAKNVVKFKPGMELATAVE